MEQTISARQLEAAYDAYGAAVFRLALAFLGQRADAEDVTQETFCRLLYRAPAFADEAHKKRWLLRVAANLSRNQLRGFWRKRVTPLEDTVPAGAPEEREALNAVMALPEKFKLPIHLYYYEGYSVAEVAEILKLGQSAVKMRLKRGRELLKLELGGIELNINDYRKAMDHIIPDQELKERIMNQKTSQRQYIPVRRVLTYVLAAALTLACLFTVALAASPELRMAVMTFFHMEEPEQLPSADPDGAPSEPGVSRAEIGELVKTQYIRMDSQYYQYCGGGLLRNLTWSEDGRTLLGAKFWEVKGNEMTPVEVELHTQQMDVAYSGVRYQGELYWYVRNGVLCAFNGSPFGVDTRPEDQWYVTTLSGRTDALLLHVVQGRQMERTEFILLYHLDTGEFEDLLAGVDPSVMEQSDGSIWSPSASRALITGRSGPELPNGREWLYDRESGTLTDVKDLGGVGADMAVFVDDDTLILRVYTYDANYDLEAIACWVYDIPSGQAVQTLGQSPCYHQSKRPYGIILFYGGSCMEIGQDGSACLIDLTTGARTMLENFTFEKDMNFSLSPAGTKLLYYAMDREVDGLGITQLGVIDLEKSTFIAFDREGYENLHEGSIGWEDDQTVSIGATSADGGTRYILLYQF